MCYEKNKCFSCSRHPFGDAAVRSGCFNNEYCSLDRQSYCEPNVAVVECRQL